MDKKERGSKKVKDAYFSSLVGRTVQVYRGGPNSNVGTLRDVTEDYLALQKANGEIVYYTTSHIKSIGEKSQGRFNGTSTVEDTEMGGTESVVETLLTANSFAELLNHFKEQNVRINGKGPESKVGRLVDVQSDFLIIYDEKDGLTFYNFEHITSVSFADLETSDEDNENEEGNNENDQQESSEDDSEEVWNHLMDVCHEVSSTNLLGVLGNLKYCWIKINRKGPESVEGLLVEANDDHLVLVVKDEIFRIATFHVKNFSVNVNYTSQSSDNDNSDDNSNNQNSNNNNSNNNNSNNSNSKGNKSSYNSQLNQRMRIKRRRMNKANQQSSAN